jgi:hypothetical protein
LEGFFSFSNMKVENAHVGQFSKDMLRVLVWNQNWTFRRPM